MLLSQQAVPAYRACLAYLVNVVNPMLEVIYPGMRHGVVTLAPSESLRVVRNNNDALIRPTPVNCDGTINSMLRLANSRMLVQSMPHYGRKGRCGRRIRGGRLQIP